jgi:hypothetical protein
MGISYHKKIEFGKTIVYNGLALGIPMLGVITQSIDILSRCKTPSTIMVGWLQNKALAEYAHCSIDSNQHPTALFLKARFVFCYGGVVIIFLSPSLK